MFDLASAKLAHVSADLAPFLEEAKATLLTALAAAKTMAITLAASTHLMAGQPPSAVAVVPAHAQTSSRAQDDPRFDAFMKQTMDNEGRGITTITPQGRPGVLLFRGVVTSIRMTASGGVLIAGINLIGNATRAILTRSDLTGQAARVITLSGIQPMPDTGRYVARGFTTYPQIASMLGLGDRPGSVEQAVDVLKALAWDPQAVRRVYHARYWENDFAKIRSNSLVAVLADSNVHMGEQRTHDYLQRAMRAHGVRDVGEMTPSQSAAVLDTFVRERLHFYEEQGPMAQPFIQRLQRTLDPYREDWQARGALALVAQACQDGADDAQHWTSPTPG